MRFDEETEFGLLRWGIKKINLGDDESIDFINSNSWFNYAANLEKRAYSEFCEKFNLEEVHSSERASQIYRFVREEYGNTCDFIDLHNNAGIAYLFLSAYYELCDEKSRAFSTLLTREHSIEACIEMAIQTGSYMRLYQQSIGLVGKRVASGYRSEVNSHDARKSSREDEKAKRAWLNSLKEQAIKDMPSHLTKNQSQVCKRVEKLALEDIREQRVFWKKVPKARQLNRILYGK